MSARVIIGLLLFESTYALVPWSRKVRTDQITTSSADLAKTPPDNMQCPRLGGQPVRPHSLGVKFDTVAGSVT